MTANKPRNHPSPLIQGHRSPRALPIVCSGSYLPMHSQGKNSAPVVGLRLTCETGCTDPLLTAAAAGQVRRQHTDKNSLDGLAIGLTASSLSKRTPLPALGWLISETVGLTSQRHRLHSHILCPARTPRRKSNTAQIHTRLSVFSALPRGSSQNPAGGPGRQCTTQPHTASCDRGFISSLTGKEQRAYSSTKDSLTPYAPS